VSYVTEELVRQGHEVTPFVSGDSETNPRLVAACRLSLRLDERYQGQMAHHFVMLERVYQRAGEQRFTATRMAHDYVQQFERLIARNQEVSEAA